MFGTFASNALLILSFLKGKKMIVFFPPTCGLIWGTGYFFFVVVVVEDIITLASTIVFKRHSIVPVCLFV